MTDPQRLADAIDPRLHQMWQNRVGLKAQDDLIAASDALRSSTTAIETGRAMGREDCISALNELYEKTKREKPGPTGDAETDMALDCAMTAIEEYSIDLRKRFGPLTTRQQEK